MSQTKAQLISDLVQALNFTGTASAPANGAFLSATNTLALATNSAQRLTIDSSGNVGIGTTSPNTTLHLDASTGAVLQLQRTASNASNRFTVSVDGTNGTLDSSNATLFRNNGSERMRIDSSGRLLLGTTTEGVANASEFTIADTGHCGMTIRSGTSHDGQIAFSDGTSGDDEFRGQIRYNHGSNYLTFVTDATERMRIDSSGDVLFYGTIRNDNVSSALNISGGNGADSSANIILNGSSGSPANVIQFRTGTTERMRIANDGKVGIGDSTPNYELQVNDPSGTVSVVQLTNTTTGTGAGDGLLMYITGNDTIISNEEAGYMRFQTSGAERMRITSDAKFGFNLTPDADGGTVQMAPLHGYQSAATNLLTSASKAVLRVRTSSDSSMSLYVGAHNNTARPYLQVGNMSSADGGATAVYPLLLQPFGGNVGIGATTIANDADHSKLAISGQSGTAAGILIFQDTANNEDGAIFSDDGNLFIVADRDNTTSSSSIRFRVDGSSEKMRIDSSGRVLIGTSSPSVSKLYVSGGSLSVVGSDSDFGGGGNRVFLDHDNNDVRFGFTGGGGSATSRGIRFHHCPNSTGTANTNRITEQGEFRIGHDGNADSATSTDKVHGMGGCNLDGNTSNLARLCMQERSGNWISFKDGSGTHYGTISRSGSHVVYGGQSSDYRIKENIVNVSNGITLLKQLRPVNFNYTADSGFTSEEQAIVRVGFIAHEYAEVCPTGVIGEKDGMDIWGDCTDSEGKTTQTHVPESKKLEGETWTEKSRTPDYQQIDFSKAVPILTAALQEAIGKIETLETEVAALKAA